MIVFTELGDTPASVTNRYLGYNDSDFASRVRQANINSFAWQVTNGAGYYAVNRAIWLPLDSSVSSTTCDHIIHIFDFMPSDTRAALATLQQAGIDHQTLLGIHALTVQANQITSTTSNEADNQSSILGLAGTAAYTTLGNINDLKRNRLDKFSESLHATKNSAEKIASAQDKTERHQARQEYKAYRKELQQSFAYELEEFKFNTTPYLGTDIAAMKRKSKKLKQKGWEIYDEFTMRDVDYMAETLKWTGRGFIGIDVIGGSVDVWDTYKEGGDWQKEAGKEGGGLIFDVGLSIAMDAGLVALSLSPIGWIAIIAVAAIETGVILGTHKYVYDDTFDFFEKTLN